MTTTLSIITYETNEPLNSPPNSKMPLQNPPRPYPHPSSVLIRNNQFHIHISSSSSSSSILTLHLHNHKPHLPPISLSFHNSKPTTTLTTRTPKTTSCTRSCISSSGSSSSSPSRPASFSSVSSFSSPGLSSKMAGMVAVDPYVLWTFFASLFGFLVLSVLRRRNYGNAKSKAQKNSNNNVPEKSITSSDHGELPPVHGTEVIIVGAGVAGGALALTLAKEGRRVHVIERDLTEPDRIVGELLQPGGYLKLIELGLEDCVEEIDAQRVVGYALFKDGKNTQLTYPLEQFHSDVAGRSFHNGRFIQRMREKAAKLPNVQLEQGTVTSLLEDIGTIKGVQYKTKDGQELKVYAPLTIVCDGCFSNLRRSLCKPQVEVPSCFVGLILENCKLPFANHGHVILADPSPILFYQISSTEVRCLVDIPGQRVPPIANGALANYLKNVVAPQVPPELHDAFVAAIDKGNIRSMPNRSMPANPHPTPGALLLGDAFNMRHPLTGGGMTVALSDIVVLRDLLKPLLNLHDAASLCTYLESFYTLRKPVASTINTLAGALYKVFSASPDEARTEMRQACFDYLSLGGVCSTGPVALLSGLNPCPLSLVLHFFAVAVYGVGRLLLPFPSPKRMWIGARLLLSASGIIFPIIKAEGVRPTFFPATIPAYHRAPPAGYRK